MAERLAGRYAAEHSRYLGHAIVAGQREGTDACATGANGLGHAQVLVRSSGDWRKVRHAEYLTVARGGGQLVGDPRRCTSPEPGIYLVEDHRRNILGGKYPVKRQHRPRQLATRCHACQRPRLFAGVSGESQLYTVEPSRRYRLRSSALDNDLEDGAIHPESTDLPLGLGRERARRARAAFGQPRRRRAELVPDLAERPLLRGQELLVALQSVQLRRSVLTEAQHGLFGIAVLPLQACEGIEPVVDRFETAGFRSDTIAELAKRDEGILDLRLCRLQCLAGRAERRVESREIRDHPASTDEPADRGRLLFREKSGHLREPGREPLSVLQALPLRAELLLFARPQTCGVELRHLESQKVLTLGTIALSGTRALDVLERRAVLSEKGRHAVPELLCSRESIDELELARGFEEAMMLVLTVHFDEVVAKAFEQRHRDRRVVHERAVAAGARQLTSDEKLAVAHRDTRILEDRDHRRTGRDIEQGFNCCRGGVTTDDVGLRPRTTHEEDGVDQDGLAGSRLTREHVEPRGELDRRVLDDGEVPDTKLSQHLEEARSANDEAQDVSARLSLAPLELRAQDGEEVLLRESDEPHARPRLDDLDDITLAQPDAHLAVEG